MRLKRLTEILGAIFLISFWPIFGVFLGLQMGDGAVCIAVPIMLIEILMVWVGLPTLMSE